MKLLTTGERYAIMGFTSSLQLRNPQLCRMRRQTAHVMAISTNQSKKGIVRGMKKRVIATVLTVIMLLLALPVSASAADLDYLMWVSRFTSENKVYITYDITVNRETTIPSYIIVYVYPGATLTLEKTLTVKGALINYGTIKNSDNIKLDGGYYQDYSEYPFLPGYPYYYPGYPYYLPYWPYPGYDYEDIQWPWPIFIPDIPTPPSLPDPNDFESIQNYYLYLLWLYNNGYIDEDEWKDYYPYWYYYTYVVTPTCAAPTASVKSGSTVEFGSTVALSTTTSGAHIYYTTDGSTPDTSAKLYTGPITINKTEMTIKAIAVKEGYKDSQVATFTYKTKASVSFSDLGAHADALLPSLITLVQAKVIPDSATLNPEGPVSYDELLGWLDAIGLNTRLAKIDESYITNKDELTYEDFAYICYRVLLDNKSGVVRTPQQSEKTVFANLKYGDVVKQAPAMVRAGIISLYEAGLLYKLDFNPEAPVTRAYVFYLLGFVYNKIN